MAPFDTQFPTMTGAKSPSIETKTIQPLSATHEQVAAKAHAELIAPSDASAADQPYEPGPEEADLYYFGAFHTHTRLVARSSTHQWSKKAPEYLGHPTMRKNYVFPLYHPIYNLWNGSNGKMARNIKKALEGLQWRTIEIFAIGYRHEDKYVTLLVSVSPDETWQRACPRAMECQKILAQYGLHDVHCEMKVGAYDRSWTA